MHANNLLATGIGGALGAMTRIIVTHYIPGTIFIQFPIKILAVNILGCFALGLITELMTLFYEPSVFIRSLIIPGFLGGFTTFSAFSLEYALLVKKNLLGLAVVYATLSLLLTISAFFLGMKIIRIIYHL